jgi:hypothetical protein
MKYVLSFSAVLILSCVGAAQQPDFRAPVASNPLVDLKGKIAKVQVAPGQGMPYVEVTDGEKTTKVYLGSMRYLMQNNFNPKAGDSIEVKGYKVSDDVMASTVTLNGGDKTLRLRDENGRPVWMGGRFGQGRGRGCCGGGSPRARQQ